MFTSSTTLPELRQIARLRIPELSPLASGEIQSRMAGITLSLEHSNLTDFLGREHFDAFASTRDDDLNNRVVASILFNQIVDSEFHGFDAYRRTRTGEKHPNRLIFDLRPSQIANMILVDTRAHVGLGPYPDETPSMSHRTEKRAGRNALERAIEVGSFITLVEQGLGQKAITSPKKPLIRAERLAIELAEHLR